MDRDLIKAGKGDIKLSARKRAMDLTIKLNSNCSTCDVPLLVSILLDWGQENYDYRSTDDKKVFFALMGACEKNLSYLVPPDSPDDIKSFIRGLFFSLSKNLGVEQGDFKGHLSDILSKYVGQGSLLEKTALKPNGFHLNVNQLKYLIWGGIEIEEDGSLLDLFRFISVIIPNDNGIAFGYSGLNVEIVGDGVIKSTEINLNFQKIQSDVDIEFLEKSLTLIVKLIKKGYDEIREDDGDIGWIDVMSKFYEKCNDPTYLTKKIGLRVHSLYQRHKLDLN